MKIVYWILKKLTKIADSTYELGKITNDLENIYLENTKKYKDQSKKLSQLRKTSALQLDNLINNEFPALKLENANFRSFLKNLCQVQMGLTELHLKLELIQTQRWVK